MIDKYLYGIEEKLKYEMSRKGVHPIFALEIEDLLKLTQALLKVKDAAEKFSIFDINEPNNKVWAELNDVLEKYKEIEKEVK